MPALSFYALHLPANEYMAGREYADVAGYSPLLADGIAACLPAVRQVSLTCTFRALLGRMQAVIIKRTEI